MQECGTSSYGFGKKMKKKKSKAKTMAEAILTANEDEAFASDAARKAAFAKRKFNSIKTGFAQDVRDLHLMLTSQSKKNVLLDPKFLDALKTPGSPVRKAIANLLTNMRKGGKIVTGQDFYGGTYKRKQTKDKDSKVTSITVKDSKLFTPSKEGGSPRTQISFSAKGLKKLKELLNKK